ncbi:MAG: hypothetical protein NC102_01100 [Clostridium sp.]|nr:hypothetical protein [Clostridium sp.]
MFTDDILQKMLDFQAAGGSNTGGLPSDGIAYGKDGAGGDPFTKAYANTEWYSEIYKDNVFSQEHNASISGGSATVNYYASIGFLDYNGLLRHGSDNLQRFSSNGRFSAKLAKWVTFNYGMKFIRNDVSRPTRFGNGFYDNLGRQTWPNLPVYDENGYYNDCNADPPSIMLALGGERKSQNDKMYQQASFVLEPVKGWVTNVEFNYSLDNTDVRETNLPYYNHNVAGDVITKPKSSSLYQDYKRDAFMNWNIYTSYESSIRDAHNYKVMVGFQSEEGRQKFFSAYTLGLQDENLPELDLTTGLDGNGVAQAPQVKGYRNQWSTLGFFAPMAGNCS